MGTDPDEAAGTSGDLVTFLHLLTRESLAYSAEGTEGIRRTIREIAHAQGGEAEVALQADSAVLTVRQAGRSETVAITTFPDVARLDRIADLQSVAEQALDNHRPASTCWQMRSTGSRSKPPPYRTWLKPVGVLLFTIGFPVNVQATWTEVGVAAITGLAVALLVWATARLPRTALLLPMLSSVTVSIIVLTIYDDADLQGGPILFMVPALSSSSPATS